MIEAYQLKIKQTIFDQRLQKDDTKKFSNRSEIPNQSTKNESNSGDGNKSAHRSKKHAILAQFSPDPIMRFPNINEDEEGLPSLKGIRNGDFSCRKRSILNIEDFSPNKRNIKSILGARLKSPDVIRTFRIETEENDRQLTPSGIFNVDA